MARPKKREPPTTAAQWDEAYAAEIKHECAAAFYRELLEDLKCAGNLNSATRSLAKDAATQEDIILTATADIRRNGAVEKMEQGTQKLRIENRSVRVKNKAEARKQDILEALGLLPGKRRAGGKAAKDEDEPGDAGNLDLEWEEFDAAE